MTTHNTRQFTYDGLNKRFAADVSDLGSNPFVQVYPDALDQGIRVVSEKTDQEAIFVVDRENYNDDGLQHWMLIPTRDSVKKNPTLRGVSMILFNN